MLVIGHGSVKCHRASGEWDGGLWLLAAPKVVGKIITQADVPELLRVGCDQMDNQLPPESLWEQCCV